MMMAKKPPTEPEHETDDLSHEESLRRMDQALRGVTTAKKGSPCSKR
jgi:hypothetical protein